MPKTTIDDKTTVGKVAFERLTADHPAYTVDQVLCDPKRAHRICNEVRAQLSRPKLSDFDILWSMLSARKRGLIQASKRKRS